jgi:hypothetical protein
MQMSQSQAFICFNMKHRTLTIAVSVAIAVLVWMGLDSRARTNAAPPQFIRGTKLELVGTHGPLQVYIDPTSTNQIPDYALFEGNKCVVLRQSAESNTIETWHFENGLNVLLTKRDKNGKILERTVSYDDGPMESRRTYIDTHGDGLWDVFLDYTRNMFYVRTNLCWVTRHQEGDQPQGDVGHSNNSTD